MSWATDVHPSRVRILQVQSPSIIIPIPATHISVLNGMVSQYIVFGGSYRDSSSVIFIFVLLTFINRMKTSHGWTLTSTKIQHTHTHTHTHAHTRTHTRTVRTLLREAPRVQSRPGFSISQRRGDIDCKVLVRRSPRAAILLVP